MNPTLLGQSIVVQQGRFYEGFWQPAVGSDGVASAEVFVANSALGVDVAVWTKESDEDDGDAVRIGSITLDGSALPKLYEFPVTNAKDLVRYVVANRRPTPATVHLQFTNPLWVTN